MENQTREYTSQKEYQEALKEYQNRDRGAEVVSGNYAAPLELNKKNENPISDIIESLNSDSEEKKRQKWERVATYTALGNLLTGAGKSIAASAGVKPTKTDTSAFDYAIKQIEQSEERERENFLQSYKDRLAQALHTQEREEKIADQAQATQNSLYQTDSKERIAKEGNSASQQNKILDFSARGLTSSSARETQSSPKAAQTSSSATKTTPTTQKIDRYVFNNNGEKVALTKEDVVRLYQIGKETNLSSAYDRSTNDTVRRNEYDLLIQQAYLFTEKNQPTLAK